MTLFRKLGGAAVAATLAGGLLATTMSAQQNRDPRDYPPNQPDYRNQQNSPDPYDRYDRNGRWDDRTRLATIDPGTFVTVRTRAPIDTDRGARTFPATVENDVWDNYRRLSVPMIRRGSPAELTVRTARDGDLILDLDSVTIDGQRYAVDASRQRVDNPGSVGASGNTGAYIGGGAVIGSIIGAIAGGGKGAAVGAIAGAAGGAALSTQGRHIAVPPNSVLTFRLDQPLSVGVRAARNSGR